jgi:hypothetical protein
MALHGILRDLAPRQADAMVFMTGGAFSAEVRRFLDSVGNVVLEKPFDPTDLKELVRSRVG